jgi:hypothetical protein
MSAECFVFQQLPRGFSTFSFPLSLMNKNVTADFPGSVFSAKWLDGTSLAFYLHPHEKQILLHTFHYKARHQTSAFAMRYHIFIELHGNLIPWARIIHQWIGSDQSAPKRIIGRGVVIHKVKSEKGTKERKRTRVCIYIFCIDRPGCHMLVVKQLCWRGAHLNNEKQS